MYDSKQFIDADVKQNCVWGCVNGSSASTELGDADNVSKVNESALYSFEDDEYIFDRTDIRAIFITLYTIVFCCCFFGK